MHVPRQRDLDILTYHKFLSSRIADMRETVLLFVQMLDA